MKLSNVSTGQFIRDFTGAPAAVTAAIFLPNNAGVAAGTADGKVTIWSADGKLTATIGAHVGAVTGIAMTANGTGFVTSGADGLLRTWAYPLNPSKTLPHPDRVLGASLAPDGKRLVTAGADKFVRTWAMPAGAAERQFVGHTGRGDYGRNHARQHDRGFRR